MSPLESVLALLTFYSTLTCGSLSIFVNYRTAQPPGAVNLLAITNNHKLHSVTSSPRVPKLVLLSLPTGVIREILDLAIEPILTSLPTALRPSQVSVDFHSAMLDTLKRIRSKFRKRYPRFQDFLSAHGLPSTSASLNLELMNTMLSTLREWRFYVDNLGAVICMMKKRQKKLLMKRQQERQWLEVEIASSSN